MRRKVSRYVHIRGMDGSYVIYGEDQDGQIIDQVVGRLSDRLNAQLYVGRLNARLEQKKRKAAK